MKNKKVIFILIAAAVGVAFIYHFNREQVYTAKYYNPKSQTTVTTDFVIRKGDTIANGKFIRQSKDGNKIVEGSFVNGQMCGQWTYFFENGNMEKSLYYKNNEIVLEESFWTPNGLVKEYDMYNLFGKRAFIIYFDRKGVKSYDGFPLMEIYQYRFSHKELYHIKEDQYLKVGDTLKYEYLLANIPNTSRSFKIENLALDNNDVKRALVRKAPTKLEVKEVLTKKGINTIRAIVQYKFKDKVTPVFNDTISFEVKVN